MQTLQEWQEGESEALKVPVVVSLTLSQEPVLTWHSKRQKGSLPLPRSRLDWVAVRELVEVVDDHPPSLVPARRPTPKFWRPVLQSPQEVAHCRDL